jgi:hypothetical protein
VISDKVQLHSSMLGMITRCGIQFQRRYGHRFGIWHEEEIVPPGIALAVGISVHKSVQRNLQNKLETGLLLVPGMVKEAAFETFNEIWVGGMMLTEQEALDQKKTRGAGADQAVNLSLLHHKVMAPKIKPRAVEKKFVIELHDFPMDLAGQMDIVESDKIGDVKTMATNKASVKSMQMALYAMAFKVEKGELPKVVYHDKLIKTKVPKAEREETVPDDSWTAPLIRRIERFSEIIDAVQSGKQALTPASPTDWVCTAKYCGYARSCKFWSGRE